MLGKCHGQYIGRNSGTSQRGPWYQISVVTDGEPYTLRCRPHVFERAGAFNFGDEFDFDIELRVYDRSWNLTVAAIDE